mgnify:FL=1
MKYLKKIMEIIAICMIAYILIFNGITGNIQINSEDIMVIAIIIIVFLLIHLLRMFRLYILLVEEKMPIKEFIKLYMKTTIVNTVIPFKLGEFYKMICYGKKLKSYSAGISLVWIDRFFDSVILIILVIVASAFKMISPIYVILSLFILFSILIYLTFENTYKYFNLLVLEKGKSKRSKIYLEIIDETKKIYKKAKNMIKYRSVPVIFLSALIWGFEYLIAYLTIEQLFNMDFSLSIFTNYINDVFIIFNTKYVNIAEFNIGIMLIIFAVVYIVIRCRERKNKNEQ